MKGIAILLYVAIFSAVALHFPFDKLTIKSVKTYFYFRIIRKNNSKSYPQKPHTNFATPFFLLGDESSKLIKHLLFCFF